MTGRYRPPPPKSASRAAPSTVCQKCLKRDIYECKSVAQERPYVPRPSRTQQLLNPKLVPKLTSDVPNELLRKKGVADEELAKAAAERGRKRAIDDEEPTASRKRSRSGKSDKSSSSVSTISTAASRSPSPRHARPSAYDHDYMTSQPAVVDDSDVLPSHTHPRKRRHSSSSRYTHDSYEEGDRNTRRRRRSTSPDERGRRRGRSGQHRLREQSHSEAADHRPTSTHMRDYSSGSGGEERARSIEDVEASRPRDSTRGGRRMPASGRRSRSRSRSPAGRSHGGNVGHERPRYRSPRKREDRMGGRRPFNNFNKAPPARERSLSPYSKRIALTQAMGGR